MQSIESRLESLERSNRRLRAGLVVCCGVGLGLALLGFSQERIAPVVRAQSFEVVDEQGMALVRIGNLQGNGYVATYGAEGKFRVLLGVTQTQEGAVVTFEDAGEPIVQIGATTAGQGRIATLDGFGKETSVMPAED